MQTNNNHGHSGSFENQSNRRMQIDKCKVTILGSHSQSWHSGHLVYFLLLQTKQKNLLK